MGDGTPPVCPAMRIAAGRLYYCRRFARQNQSAPKSDVQRDSTGGGCPTLRFLKGGSSLMQMTTGEPNNLRTHHHFDARIFFIPEHFVSFRRLFEPQAVADNLRRIDLALFDSFKQRLPVFVNVRLAHSKRQAP